MTVKVSFSCDGCFKTAEGTTYLKRHTEPLFSSGAGVTHGGFVRYTFDKPQDVAPEGWMAFDPVTGCCYCPECVEAIWPTVHAAQEGGRRG